MLVVVGTVVAAVAFPAFVRYKVVAALAASAQLSGPARPSVCGFPIGRR